MTSWRPKKTIDAQDVQGLIDVQSAKLNAPPTHQKARYNAQRESP